MDADIARLIETTHRIQTRPLWQVCAAVVVIYALAFALVVLTR